jgi:hypothetical protein
VTRSTVEPFLVAVPQSTLVNNATTSQMANVLPTVPTYPIQLGAHSIGTTTEAADPGTGPTRSGRRLRPDSRARVGSSTTVSAKP